jgi:hypothetical protein
VRTTVTTTMWVIDSVHGDTADTWANAHVTFAASGTDLDILVLLVANATNGSHTL